MAKRFIDTALFRKPSIRAMKAPYKALFIYLLCECDHSGVWDVELDVAAMRLGLKLEDERAIEELGGTVVPVDGGRKWWLVEFVEFQYGELNPANRVHASVLSRLSSLGIDLKNKPPASPLKGAKDKDKDMDKDKDLDKEKDKEKENARETRIDLTAPESYADLWLDFLAHRREIRKPMTLRSQRATLDKLAAMTNPAEALRNSISNGWQGIFEPQTPSTNGKHTDQSRDERKRLVLEAVAQHHRDNPSGGQ